jgi:hypothetical protein
LKGLEQPALADVRPDRRIAMSDNVAASLSVSIGELPPVHVAYIDYKVNVEQGDLHDES